MAKKSARVGFYLESTRYNNGEIKNNEELFLKLEQADENDKHDIINEIFKNNVRSVHAILQRRFKGRVYTICNQYRITYDDLFALGCEALWRCIRRFDISRGFKFTTYLYRSIHLDLSKYFERLKINPNDVSMDKALCTDDKGRDKINLGHILHDEDISDSIVDSRFLAEIMEALDKEYSSRDMAIFREFLSGSLTQTEIGKKFGMTQAHVSRIVRKIQNGARKIRDEWESAAI